MPEEVKDERKFTDHLISENGNGLGAEVIRVFEDGERRTVHTGPRYPKARTSHAKGRTNVGSSVDNLRLGRKQNA